jgi:WD40 repeat protein
MQICQQNAIWRHKDTVTCCSICENDKYFVTGSKDTTVMVWNVQNNECFNVQQPINILYGHDDEVTCVAVNEELDIVLSASKDGTLIIHSLKRGKYIRTIKPPNNKPIKHFELASTCNRSINIDLLGRILIYSTIDKTLYMYSINGKLLKSVETKGIIYAVKLFDCKYVVEGGGSYKIFIRNLTDLSIICTYDLSNYHSAIRSIQISNDEQYMFVGLDDGKMVVLSFNN